MDNENLDQILEAESIREAMSQKKDRYRVEIRKKTLSNYLRTKRIEGFSSTYNPVAFSSSHPNEIPQTPLTNLQPNSTSQALPSLQSIIDYLLTFSNQANTSGNNHQSSTTASAQLNESVYPPHLSPLKALDLLHQIRLYIHETIFLKDVDELDRRIHEFTVLNGASMLISFTSQSIPPALILQSIISIGNIFFLTKKQILADLCTNNIVKHLSATIESACLDLLVKKNDFSLQLSQHQPKEITFEGNTQINSTQLTTQQTEFETCQLNLICESLRSLANIASESIENQIEIVRVLSPILNSENFQEVYDSWASYSSSASKPNATPQSKLPVQTIFCIRNLLHQSSFLSDEDRISFLPLISKLFTAIPLPQNAIINQQQQYQQQQHDIQLNSNLSVGDYNIDILVDYSETIKGFTIPVSNNNLRAKILCKVDIFMKVHEMITTTSNVKIQLLGLQTLKEFMRFSDRQAEFVFSLSGAQIFTTLSSILLETKSEQYTKQQQQQSRKNEDEAALKIAAIEVINLYAVCENRQQFERVFNEAFSIIEAIMHIAIYESNNSVNFKAKEFLFVCIQKANFDEQKVLVDHNIILPLIDAIKEDGPSLIIKSLRSLAVLLNTASLDQQSSNINYSDLNNDLRNPVQKILEDTYQIKELLEALQANPNNDIHAGALFLLDNYFAENQQPLEQDYE